MHRITISNHPVCKRDIEMRESMRLMTIRKMAIYGDVKSSSVCFVINQYR